MARPRRQCTIADEIVKIHELAFSASKINRKNTQMLNLTKIWVPGNEIMIDARKFSLINSRLFCSTPARRTSIEVSESMLGCNSYCDEIIDAYSGILELSVSKNNIRADDHCIFFPVEFSVDILMGNFQGRVHSYLDSHILKEKSTMQIFSPVSMKATKTNPQNFALICIDLLEFTVCLFDASKKVIGDYDKILKAYVKFADAEFVDKSQNRRRWKARVYNFVNGGVPELDAFHSGPLVCVLMDIFSASCEYNEVGDYLNNNNMMIIRALLYQYMSGFHYNAAGDVKEG